MQALKGFDAWQARSNADGDEKSTWQRRLRLQRWYDVHAGARFVRNIKTQRCSACGRDDHARSPNPVQFLHFGGVEQRSFKRRHPARRTGLLHARPAARRMRSAQPCPLLRSQRPCPRAGAFRAGLHCAFTILLFHQPLHPAGDATARHLHG